MLNVSHENDLIFMRMNVQVTYIFISIVSQKDSFCYRGKSKLGIGLFIHELLREPMIVYTIREKDVLQYISQFLHCCSSPSPKCLDNFVLDT